jgi:hypothetical protein
MEISEEETKTSDDGDYIDPPDGCRWCIVPKNTVELTACNDYQVAVDCFVVATISGVDSVTNRFNDHCHSTTAGPPEIHQCFFTGNCSLGAGHSYLGAVYANITALTEEMRVISQIRTSWNSGTGSLLFRTEFIDSDASWYYTYEYSGLSSTYADEAAFTIAVNTYLADLTNVTLSYTSTSGTIPTGVTMPSTIRNVFA